MQCENEKFIYFVHNSPADEVKTEQLLYRTYSTVHKMYILTFIQNMLFISISCSYIHCSNIIPKLKSRLFKKISSQTLFDAIQYITVLYCTVHSSGFGLFLLFIIIFF